MSEAAYEEFPGSVCVLQFGPRSDRRVATLGDALASTCSILFAKTWLAPEGGVIAGYLSFEEALDAVLVGATDYLVVPAAYPRLKEIIFFGSDVQPVDQFIDSLPDMVMVSTGGGDPVDAPPRLYFHPALGAAAARLRERWGPDVEYIEVTSNPVACERALEDRDVYALTNLIAATAYDTPVLEIVEKGVRMPVLVFKLDEAGGAGTARDLRPWTGR